MQWCPMCIFLFVKFYNCIQGIVCIFKHSVFKKLRPLFLYYFINLFKYWYILTELMYLSLKSSWVIIEKNLSKFFCMHCISLKKVKVIIFSFFLSCFFSSLVMQQILHSFMYNSNMGIRIYLNQTYASE